MSSEVLPHFTPRAQQVLALARQEADRLHWPQIGTEHFLAAILRQGGGVAFDVLHRHGVSINQVLGEIERADPPVQPAPVGAHLASDHLPYSLRVKKALRQSALETRKFNLTYLGTDLILAALLHDSDGTAAKILTKLGVDIQVCRREIHQELAPGYVESELPDPDAPDGPVRQYSVGFPELERICQGVNKFTPRALLALRLARSEAERFQHTFVGTEHVLLGIIKLGEGCAVSVLRRLNLDLEVLRQETENQFVTGSGLGPANDSRPFTPQVAKVLRLAANEVRTLGHAYLGTEHLLLGLVREGEGVAGRVLKNHGVDPGTCRQEILKELDPGRAG